MQPLTPISPAGPMNPSAGYNPLDLVALLQAQIAENSINFQQLFLADAIAGVEKAWRIVFRSNAVDVASGQWGTPSWGEYGEVSSEAGTTNVHDVTRFMALSNTVPYGMYEVQFQIGDKWYSAASVLRMNPQVAVAPGTMQPILYEPGQLSLYNPSFEVPAQRLPPVPTPVVNVTNPVGSPVPGFANAFHNIGGMAFSTDGMKDPTERYILRNPSPMLNDPGKMLWIKQV